MKILKNFYEKFIRLAASACQQLPLVLVGLAFYFYAHHTFPDKIQNAFGIAEAQDRLAQITQSTVFMKNMIGLSNPMASVNYLSSLMDRTVAWSRLTSSQMFANALTAFSLWLTDIFLFIGGCYLIWRTYKTYRQKGYQRKNAQLILKEFTPYFTQLNREIQNLQKELHDLKGKNGKGNSADSPEPWG